MSIIGREREQDVLQTCLQSDRPEFLAVYGRRRVGKTYLIKEYFNNRFSFYATGVYGVKTRAQLKVFHESLREYGSSEKVVPKDWFEAFSRLKEIILSPSVKRDVISGKKVVFLDELPWMDTARSDFKSALEYFWNSWASSQKDLLLIVCGSATSWIIENLLASRGGFYNRITRQIFLQPFSLKECDELYRSSGISLSNRQLLESYMIFGGIPYYLTCMDRRLSLAQNVEELCFKTGGQLYYEYDHLFRSLFRNAEKHMAILNAISKKSSGTTRTELAGNSSIGDGEPLTKALRELEQCGFIRKYRNFTKKKSEYYFQLIDPFTLFSIHFLNERNINSWLSYLDSPGYYAWSGYAFELVCLLHTKQIKTALGISGVESMEYSWQSKKSSPGAQIDLLIDRKDDVINVCEMKFSQQEYAIDAAYEKQLRNKMSVFREETSCRKALHLTMITADGIRRNEHSGIVINEITGKDLFRF